MGSVLVTGGAGFLGSHLVEKLVQKKFDVRVMDNSWRGSQKNLGNILKEIEFVEADIRDFQKVKDASKDVDIIFHLASIQGTKFFYSDPELVLEVGIQGSLNVAKAATENGVGRILYTSSSEVYGTPQYFPTDEKHPIIIPDIKNPRWSYSAQKIIGESIFLNYAKKSGFSPTIIRPHNAYGPRMGWEHVIPEFIRRIALGEKFTIQGKGTETRSFCYADDIIEGMILAATKEEGKNEIFNLGNPSEEVAINDLVKLLEKISNKKLKPVHIEKLEGSVEKRKPDISKAKKLLGFEPKTSLENGLKKTYEWYEKEIRWWLENKKPEEYPWKR